MDDFLESSQTVEKATRKSNFLTNVPSISSEFQHDCELLENDMKVLPTVEDSSHLLGVRWNHRTEPLDVSRC